MTDYDALIARLKFEEEAYADRVVVTTLRQAREAIEELAEDIFSFDSLFKMAQKRERPWIKAWQKATGKAGRLPDYGKLLIWLCDRAETAEARVAELEGARQMVSRDKP